MFASTFWEPSFFIALDMENLTHLSGPAITTDQDIVVLRCPDLLHFDPAPLNRLFLEKGPADAEEIICRILEDIARRLDMLQQGLENSDFAMMLKPARRIGLIADQIGMTEVSVAAYHVATCLKQEDGVALEATIARLERGFDVAVSEVWTFRNIG